MARRSVEFVTRRTARGPRRPWEEYYCTDV